MAGIFDYFSEPQLKRAESARGETVIDAPLLLGVQRLQERYHKKATKSTAMDVTVTSPDFKKLMKQFGKKQKHSISGKPISILVTNTAKRTASAAEISRGFGKFVYYAKFVEYGFHYKEVSESGEAKMTFRPGMRLFEKNKSNVAKIITNELKMLPDKYDRDSIYTAMKAAGIEIGQSFSNISPSNKGSRWVKPDTRAVTNLKESWAVNVVDSSTNESTIVYGRFVEGQ